MDPEKWDEFGEGTSVVGDVPRNARLWDPQFARHREQAHVMRQLPFTGCGSYKRGHAEVLAHVNFRATMGDTTIVRFRDGSDGHWRLSGGALTLPMLWQRFGSVFTASELSSYYLNCSKLVRTRPHAWGSREARAAAYARWVTYGSWGHRD